MSQPESKQTLVPVCSANGVDASKPGQNGDSRFADAKTLTSPPITDHTGSGSTPFGFFMDNLADAERLLKYAAESGIEIDPDIRSSVLAARAECRTGWSEKTVAHLLDSLTKLAARLKPVTAESLKACSRDSRGIVQTYWVVAICLAILIIPFSVASFVTSAISDAIRKDIVAANELARISHRFRANCANLSEKAK